MRNIGACSGKPDLATVSFHCPCKENGSGGIRGRELGEHKRMLERERERLKERNTVYRVI